MYKLFSIFYKRKKSSEDSVDNSTQKDIAVNNIIDTIELQTNGEYFYVRGWNTFQLWQNKMLRHFGDDSKPYLDDLWKAMQAKNLAIKPEYLASPSITHKNKRRNSKRYIPSHIKEFVYERDEGRCVECGSKRNLHFDHIIPLSKGGSSNNSENIQILCDKCNLSKGNSFKY